MFFTFQRGFVLEKTSFFPIFRHERTSSSLDVTLRSDIRSMFRGRTFKVYDFTTMLGDCALKSVFFSNRSKISSFKLKHRVTLGWDALSLVLVSAASATRDDTYSSKPNTRNTFLALRRTQSPNCTRLVQYLPLCPQYCSQAPPKKENPEGPWLVVSKIGWFLVPCVCFARTRLSPQTPLTLCFSGLSRLWGTFFVV